MFRHYRTLLGVLAASVLLALPAAAASSAIPGTVNYVEGQVAVAGQTVTPQSVGSVQLQPNQVLETGQGRAEILLTPGVFLRVGDNSAVRLVSPGLADTRVEVLRGHAIVEVAELFKDNNLWVAMNGASTRLAKEGLYAFNADSRQVQVFDGEATVQQGDRHVAVKKDHLINLNGTNLNGPWKTVHFDPKFASWAGSVVRLEQSAVRVCGRGQHAVRAKCFRGRRLLLVWTWLVLESLLGHVRIHPGRWHLVQPVWMAVLLALGGWILWRVWIRLARLSPRLCRTQFRGSRRAWACERERHRIGWPLCWLRAWGRIRWRRVCRWNARRIRRWRRAPMRAQYWRTKVSMPSA